MNSVVRENFTLKMLIYSVMINVPYTIEIRT